jgi:hypothetical protein
MPVADALMHDERPANHAGVTRSGWLMLFLQKHFESYCADAVVSAAGFLP